MLIPVFTPTGEVQEWALVELQGKVDSTIGEEHIQELGTLFIPPHVRHTHLLLLPAAFMWQ